MFSSGSSSWCARMGTSPIGISFDPSMRAVWYSHGSRTSSRVKLSPRWSFCFTSSGCISNSIRLFHRRGRRDRQGATPVQVSSWRSEGSVHSCSGSSDLFSGLRRAPPDKSVFACSALPALHVLIPEIRRRSPRMLLDAKFVDAARPELFNIGCPIRYSVNPALRPTFKICFRLCLFMILAEKRVVAPVIALHRRRMRTERTLHHRAHQEARDDGTIRVAGNDLRVHDLLRHHDHVFRCSYALDHHPEIAPAVRVAAAVGSLHVHDGHVRIDRAYCEQRFLSFKRREDTVEKVIAFRHVATHGGAGGQERNAHFFL